MLDLQLLQLTADVISFLWTLSDFIFQWCNPGLRTRQGGFQFLVPTSIHLLTTSLTGRQSGSLVMEFCTAITFHSVSIETDDHSPTYHLACYQPPVLTQPTAVVESYYKQFLGVFLFFLCAINSGSMVPMKDPGRSLVWLCQQWPDSPDHPVFCDCQVPPPLSPWACCSNRHDSRCQPNHFWTIPRKLEKTVRASALNINPQYFRWPLSFNTKLTNAGDAARCTVSFMQTWRQQTDHATPYWVTGHI